MSTVTDVSLAALRDKYKISDEFELLQPCSEDRVCFPPSKYYSVYEEHLKSGITFPPHRLVVELLRFWNFPYLLGKLSVLWLFVGH